MKYVIIGCMIFIFIIFSILIFSENRIGEISTKNIDFFYRINFMRDGNTAFYFRFYRNNFELGNYFGKEYVENYTIVKNKQVDMLYVLKEITYHNFKYIHYVYMDA